MCSIISVSALVSLMSHVDLSEMKEGKPPEH